MAKYGLSDEDDESVAIPTPEELDILDAQRKQQAVIQRAKQPFREIQMVDGFDKVDLSASTNVLVQSRLEESIIPKLESLENEGCIRGLDVDRMRLSTKKFKYDGTLYEQGEPAHHESPSKNNESKSSALKIRSPVNNFSGITSSMLKKSVLSSFGLGIKSISFNSRRSCRIGFGQKFFFLSPNEHQFLTAINISKISIVPCVEQYFEEYLESKGRLEELKELKKSELLRWNPPSLLLKLVDLFVLDANKVRDDYMERQITSLCEALLLPATADRGILQRIQFGSWLRNQLSKNCDVVKFSSAANNDKFFAVYVHLINGSVREAVEAARNQRLYNLSLLISLFCAPAAAPMQDQIFEQAKRVLHRKKNFAKSDFYYEKILQILSGTQQSRELEPVSEFCLAGLNWMQALGVIIWYWCKPSTTLLECIEQYEELAKNRLIIDKDLYI